MLGYAATNPTNAVAMLLTIKTGPKKNNSTLSNRVYSSDHFPVKCLSKHIIATRPYTFEALERKTKPQGSEKKGQQFHTMVSFSSYAHHYFFVSFQRQRLTQSRRQGYPSRLPRPPSLPCDARHQIRPPAASIALEPRPVATGERCSRLTR